MHEGGDSEHPYLQTRRMVSLQLSSSIHTLVQREASRQRANRKTFIRFLGHITDYMHLRQSAPQHTAHNMTTSRTRTHKALRKLESNHDSLVKDWTLHSRVWLLLTKNKWIQTSLCVCPRGISPSKKSLPSEILKH